jgi:hypothetical protein
MQSLWRLDKTTLLGAVTAPGFEYMAKDKAGNYF